MGRSAIVGEVEASVGCCTAMNPDQAHLHDPALLERWFNKLAKTIAVDFDGVLHPYTKGWIGSVPDNEPPIMGAAQFLTDLREQGYEVVVFSTRADHPDGLNGILEWLEYHGLLADVVRVTHKKPAAIAYVDDRAVPFTGSWGDVHDGIARLASSRPHGAGHSSA